MFQGQCYHCKNHVSWLAIKATDWLELFFIPLVPFGSKHFLACGICGDAIELDKEEGRGIDNFDRLDGGDRQEWCDYLAERVEDHQFENMSETQRNWHQQQSD